MDKWIDNGQIGMDKWIDNGQTGMDKWIDNGQIGMDKWITRTRDVWMNERGRMDQWTGDGWINIIDSSHLSFREFCYI